MTIWGTFRTLDWNPPTKTKLQVPPSFEAGRFRILAFSNFCADAFRRCPWREMQAAKRLPTNLLEACSFSGVAVAAPSPVASEANVWQGSWG